VQESAFLVIYVPPVGFQQFRPGVGKRIPAESVLYWNLHYTPTGKPETDRTKLGLWFHATPMTTEAITRWVGDTFITQGQEVLADRPTRGSGSRSSDELPPIPPFEDSYAATGITAFQDDVTIHLVWPHMHLRGKDMAYLVTYPDGREEILLNVPRYKFEWQIYYEFDQPVKLPAGSTIRTIGHFDNSTRNRENPSPDKPVLWSEQSWEEMFTGFYEVSIDKNERKPGTASRATR
jgi:hypothetical protein